ncbi:MULTISPECIES: ABC transporter substrate-binding protein [Rhizobium/Agrobacterium group]|uniref:Probable sugar-binding periplasmic protein n=4 Tax=Rhizobium/Agrobacterium group TaxID=227290 RepID=A0A546X6C7_RHIRH|nr:MULTISPECIES: ABC transporter substrate-binding protein [Rhizobium/Agrobacterium group]MBO9126330.1 carbohydrate ABC transporter substrate-binding protein [Rhizobium sp. 16-488-2b]MBO9176914.1 carbohydrate ABC transporter substrate-binding protein [Rhizobium sp. 16-488-2a]MBO9197483.1 carbohydrate ABC transporter substrate-binding protein [Rhizobium sp. 16-449-1b]MCZ7466828.1 ABC transporter substrate-binding protein [Rhizobium rhizogenes]MCZ7472320.1 ABC transporter substrate-binding prote
MTFSNKAKHLGLVLAPLVFGLPSSPVSADERGAIDVVHYWVSKSEARALDVFRDAWSRAGNRWIDLPMENKVAVQRTVSDRVASGYAPAVMQWNANEGSRELPEMGIVLDLEEVAAADRWREVLPATVVDRISFKGKIYFAPTNIHAENWLWTSKALFDRLGLPAPRTWEEIIGAADRIKQEGHVALALGGGRWEISLIFNNIMYQQLGSQGYARVIRGDASMIRDPRMAEALSMLRRLSSYAEPAQRRVGKTWADAAAAVGSGDAGMQFMGDWAKGELMTRGYVLDKDFQCSLVPGTEIAYFMVVDAFAFPITNREASIKAQRDFARVVMDPVNQVAFSGLKGSLPVRTDVDPSNLDRCGRLGLEMIARNSDVSAQSMAMPAQMSEAFIAVLANFFDDDRIPVESAQEQLYAVLSKK